MSWKKILAGPHHLLFTHEEVEAQKIQEQLQAKYPGNYTVVPFINAQTFLVEFKIQFADPLDHTAWILSYGDQ